MVPPTLVSRLESAQAALVELRNWYRASKWYDTNLMDGCETEWAHAYSEIEEVINALQGEAPDWVSQGEAADTLVIAGAECSYPDYG